MITTALKHVLYDNKFPVWLDLTHIHSQTIITHGNKMVLLYDLKFRPTKVWTSYKICAASETNICSYALIALAFKNTSPTFFTSGLPTFFWYLCIRGPKNCIRFIRFDDYIAAHFANIYSSFLALDHIWGQRALWIQFLVNVASLKCYSAKKNWSVHFCQVYWISNIIRRLLWAKLKKITQRVDA